MTTSSALPQIDETLLATTRYLQALTVLDDESVRRPSVLPGWTRAHVVAHLSRNADAFTRVLGAGGGRASRRRCTPPARRGTPRSRRPCASRPRRPRRGRDRLRGPADRGALGVHGRPGHAVRAGRRGAGHVPAAHGGAAAPGRGGDPPRRPRHRLRAVDLAAGLLPRDGQAAAGRAGRAARRRAVDGAGATDVDGLWKLGAGQGPEIRGTAGDLAWWLVGRGDGRGLTCSSGELPTLGRWR